MIQTVVVIAKRPVPGKVKTRLIGQFTAEQACDLAAAALQDTLDAAETMPCATRVLLLSGRSGGIAGPGWRVVTQARGGLDRRLAAGFAQLDVGPAFLVGMDTPQLRAEHLSFDPDRYDACLGPAADGGYWAIGFADPRMAAGTIRGVPMSTAETGAVQLHRLRQAGLRVQLLAELTDVDTPVEAERVARADPDTRFARCWRGHAESTLRRRDGHR
ncbi:MAG TPA: DUF2064 domain-containing protein [Jatrophihabitans sp.]